MGHDGEPACVQKDLRNGFWGEQPWISDGSWGVQDGLQPRRNCIEVFGVAWHRAFVVLHSRENNNIVGAKATRYEVLRDAS